MQSNVLLHVTSAREQTVRFLLLLDLLAKASVLATVLIKILLWKQINIKKKVPGT